MKKSVFSRALSLLLCLMMLAGAALSAAGCGKTASPSASPAPVVYTADTTLGEGAHTFTLTVTDKDGNSLSFDIHTDASTVGEALLALNLIAGEDSQYGLYVKTVNGITADYDKDKTYWAFYIDGEYASTGVDSTAISDGSTYLLKVENG